MIRLPTMTPASAAGFTQAVQSYVFKSFARRDYLPDHLHEPVPVKPKDLTVPRTVETLLFKQEAIDDEELGDRFEVDPSNEILRLLKAVDHFSPEQASFFRSFPLDRPGSSLRRDALPLFDAVMGQFVNSVQVLDLEDWPAHFAGMGVMSYLNVAGALELCERHAGAELFRMGAPCLSRKEGRVDGLVQAARIWMIGGRLSLATYYLDAADREMRG